MTNDSRIRKLWMDFTCFVLPLVTLLSVVLVWPASVQLALTVLFFTAVLGTRVALARADRRR